MNSDQSRILSSSAVMASGTIVSRLSGFVRSALLAAALGAGLHADVFNISNTIPNMLYILLAGGIFNAVLVPQLVRAMRNDSDGGEAYTNRIVTLAGLFLLTVTTLLVIAAPWVMQLFLDPSFNTSELAEQRDSVIDFARFCLPQVFFYGMFVLVGQILNARGRFGPMMWAPIANNIISVAVLVVYLFAFEEPEGAQLHGGYTLDQELVLGVGSTLGIAAQFLILVPYLKAAGFRYRPRFDFRNTGLGHTLRLGVWTVLFVVVNQIAYTIVVRLASSGTADNDDGTGYTIYAQTFLLVMVPHSVVTVSLATAILPRLSASAADADLGGTGQNPVVDAAIHARPDRSDGVHPARRVPRDQQGRLGSRCRRVVVRELRPLPGSVRARAAVLHRPLSDAARLLRPRAHPHRVLGPVRGGLDQHRARPGARPAGVGEGHLARTRARLRRVLPRRCVGVVPPPAAPARAASTPRCWCGSWSACSSPPGWPRWWRTARSAACTGCSASPDSSERSASPPSSWCSTSWSSSPWPG